MTRDLNGQRILITGASSGIGRALAEQAARAGARLALVSRSADKLNELAGQRKRNYHCNQKRFSLSRFGHLRSLILPARSYYKVGRR